ncbi:MAG: hypothetical protein M3R27_16000 [Bacteroidota bacterium]|nr:hypothetical protein [Bacteroidota bacterium]
MAGFTAFPDFTVFISVIADLAFDFISSFPVAFFLGATVFLELIPLVRAFLTGFTAFAEILETIFLIAFTAFLTVDFLTGLAADFFNTFLAGFEAFAADFATGLALLFVAVFDLPFEGDFFDFKLL